MYIFNKYNIFFILYNIGVVLLSKFKYKNSSFDLYIIKKKLYSFLRKNEYKMWLFNSKKKYILNNILWYNNSSSEYNFKMASNNVIFNYYKFNKSKYSNLSKSSKNFESLKELRINRIKFKPGYQRLWRNFRLALAEFIEYKYIYQKQLTKYIFKFLRKTNQNYLTQNENKIIKVYIYSKLVLNTSMFNLFKLNNLLFLNNVVLKSINMYIYKNDFIQVQISNWYYIFSKWMLNLLKYKGIKYKKLIFKKSLPLKYTLMKQKKQVSNYIPKWITKLEFDFLDVKSYLEVDFFTLSVFFIYDHNHLIYYTPTDALVIRNSVFKLYNWKYIN